YLWHSDNNTFADNDVSWNEGIYFLDSNKNIFLNNTISHNSDGISIQISNDLTFHGNEMVGNGFLLWDNSVPEQWNSHTIDVTNTVNGRPVYYWKNVTGGAIPPDAGQVLLYNCNGVVIENQNLSAATVGAHSFLSSNLEIHNNTASSNFIGIWLQSANFGNVTANILTNTWDMLIEQSDHINIANNSGPNDRGIWLDESHNNTYFNNSKSIQLMFSHDNLVTGNNISGGRGFEIVGSNDNIISSNNISTNWAWRGMHFSGSFRNALVNNTVFNSSTIELEGSSNNMIRNNQFMNNGLGLNLYLSTENLIENNTISLSNNSGLELWVLSNNNTIANNTISSNGLYGIYVRHSFDNTVYHNRFINNSEQAFNHVNCSNQWDNGYPMGGNYWSDYTGTDGWSGPLQNILGSDGIGDSPYDIQGGFDEDRYPLMSPSGPIFPRPPLSVYAELSGKDMENVTVVWLRSPDDGGGFETVVRYDILRNTTYEASGMGYGFVGSVPNGTNRFVDVSVGEGDPNNYFYVICAVDFNNNSTCSKFQASKFTRALSKGLNLVSTPVSWNVSVETVLQTLSYDNAWSYHSPNQEWKSYAKSKPYNGVLEHIFHTIGVWVNVTEDSNFTIAGAVPTTTTIDLKAGWNWFCIVQPN
ncbi:MAG: right-handed parallel beta-helix repeat-containing protein, partial [Thermoplasmata archaeon]|nr:right-handed parallel beta-helix repeat-containing protein [Thermoplasmata archaeon]